MARLREIREPERFSPPKTAAESLRAVARQVEQHADWVAWSINSYASEEEVRTSLAAKKVKAAKGGAK